MYDIHIGDRVQRAGVKSIETGEVADITEKGIVIHLESETAVIADLRSLSKVEG